ncbi:hypothetical protein C8R45DRAFT_850294, partial [Mycena sanguinolenta]
FHVAMDDDIAGISQALYKSRWPREVYLCRIKGQERCLISKCADFSVQTAIMDDPNLELDKVRVLQSIAMNLTYPERDLWLISNSPTETFSFKLSDAVRHCSQLSHSVPRCCYVVRETGEWIDVQ